MTHSLRLHNYIFLMSAEKRIYVLVDDITASVQMPSFRDAQIPG